MFVMAILALGAVLAGPVAIILLFVRTSELERRLRRLEDRGGAGSTSISIAGAATAGAGPAAQRPPAPVPDITPVADFVTVQERQPEPEPGPATEFPSSIAPEFEPAAPIEPAPPVRVRTPISLEDLFGRRLPIWVGGIALAVAGMLIVRYSIEHGLLSPLVRVVMGFAFGGLLIATAEAALRTERWVRDPRVRQALSGAGIATLYASFLLGSNLYGLIGPAAAFIGMALVTGLAMFLSLRFGAPSALLGLVGGFAAPALIGSAEPNVPLLSIYLALVVGGLSLLGRSQRWVWLGAGALIGGFGWGATLLAGGGLDSSALLAIGFYLLLIGIAVPALTAGEIGRSPMRIGASLAAAAQMAWLVAQGGFEPLHWGLFGLLSVAIVWLSRRDAGYVALAPTGLVVALLLAAAWPDPTPGLFAAVLGGALAIYGLPALQRLWSASGSLLEAAQIAGLAVAVLLIAMKHFFDHDPSSDALFAMLSLGAASLPAVAALLGLDRQDRHGDARFAVLTSTSAALVMAAAAFVLPDWLLGAAAGTIAVTLLAIRIAARDLRVEITGWAFLALAVVLSFDNALFGLRAAVGLGPVEDAITTALQWLSLGAAAAAFAWRASWREGGLGAQALAVLACYVGLAQLLAPDLLPLVPAAALVGLALWSRTLARDSLLPALGALLALSLAWAIAPLAAWAGAALLSLAGDPMLVTALPPIKAVLLQLLAPALLIGASHWLVRQSVDPRGRTCAIAVASVFALVSAHALFKQLFAIASLDDFAAVGLGERLVWDSLLLALALGCWTAVDRIPDLRTAARLLWGAATLHLLWYSMLLHNVLWAAQSVGALPLLNLLVPLFGIAFATSWMIVRHEPEWARRFARPRAIVHMALIALLAASELRQLFHGALLIDPGTTQAEDILRSVVAIALAIGFLLHGIARRSRDWRIASLVLMTGAVGKVFLLDAAGLEGLLRIASFIALGLSLIALGWLYSRHLGGDEADRPATASL